MDVRSSDAPPFSMSPLLCPCFTVAPIPRDDQRRNKILPDARGRYSRGKRLLRWSICKGFGDVLHPSSLVVGAKGLVEVKKSRARGSVN